MRGASTETVAQQDRRTTSPPPAHRRPPGGRGRTDQPVLVSRDIGAS
jgi:hypothetical protein